MLVGQDGRAAEVVAQILRETSSTDEASASFETSEAGVVTFTGRGNWTAEDCDRQLMRSKTEIMRARALSSRIKLLADVRDAEFGPEAESRISKHMGLLIRPGDRIAFVVRSSLAKTKLRQSFVGDSVNYFLSIDTARMWLGAHA